MLRNLKSLGKYWEKNEKEGENKRTRESERDMSKKRNQDEVESAGKSALKVS